MEKIVYELGRFRVETSLASAPTHARIINKKLSYGKEKELAILSNDEIPFFFQAGDFLGGMLIDQQASLDGCLKEGLKEFIAKEGVDPKDIHCYFAPSLTFAYVPTTRELQLELIHKGYMGACKRTAKVDYLDLPLLNVLYLRELGIPMVNIEITEYGTVETPYLASKVAGRPGENLNLAKLK